MRNRFALVIVFFLFIINSTFCQSDEIYDNVKVRLKFQSDGRMIDGKYLYKITANVLTVPFSSSDTDLSHYSNLQIIINGKAYYFSDINYMLKDEYMGRLRVEPFILLKESEVLTIKIISIEKDENTGNIVVPRKMEKVSIFPDFDVKKINTKDQYIITWEDIEADFYEWTFYSDSSGEGNSVIGTSLIIGSELLVENGKAKENIGFEINSINKTVIIVGTLDVLVSIESPGAWVVMNYEMEY